ncbi:alpha/beta hydrolase [Galbibacter sp. EGI 63066]|nr:alpha/beta hydrolase [Galbibacter sp. EGI 63066]MCX2679111.1 alpha/beta hydrolase [Galbibacter sp. EGI 63066]
MTIIFITYSAICFAQETNYKTISNIPYYDKATIDSDTYIEERCVLDLYYPTDIKDYPTVVWFHGGGLTGGSKELPEALKNKKIAVVGVNYRLNPKVKAPKYIEDAAAAVAWVFKNIKNYNGDPNLIFVSGHSAGGYLTSMIGLDESYLKAFDVDANAIAGLIPFSGHTITHFTVRKERGIPGTQAIVDSLAPLYHVRDDAPPLLLITGDRELEMLGRYEENAYLMRMMKVVGHKETTLYEMDGYGHGMTQPAFPLLINEVQRIVERKTERGQILPMKGD